MIYRINGGAIQFSANPSGTLEWFLRLAEPGVMEIFPTTDNVQINQKIVVDASVHVGATSFPKRVFCNGTEFSAVNGFLDWTGRPGAQDQGTLQIHDMSVWTGALEVGVKLRNHNKCFHSDWRLSGGLQTLVLGNTGDGQSERSEFQRVSIVNGKGDGLIWSGVSHRETKFDGTISGTPRPMTIGPTANMYGSEIRVGMWLGGMDQMQLWHHEAGFAAACIHGNIHDADIDLLIENEHDGSAPLLYLGDKRTTVQGQSISTQKQGKIRMHTVHVAPFIAMFAGDAADLPEYRFTHGNPANGNRNRVQWHCNDEQVMAHSGGGAE